MSDHESVLLSHGIVERIKVWEERAALSSLEKGQKKTVLGMGTKEHRAPNNSAKDSGELLTDSTAAAWTSKRFWEAQEFSNLPMQKQSQEKQ